ncbi:MAG TPA: hypothetical protein VJP77_00530, partial [Planctomycetota bacterium]|nr:hypothetical protein [Planctomycetota bacterium]
MKHLRLPSVSLLLAACGAAPAADVSVVEAAAPSASPYVTEAQDGRLWVFERDSEAYAAFRASGESAARYTAPGAGP